MKDKFVYVLLRSQTVQPKQIKNDLFSFFLFIVYISSDLGWHKHVDSVKVVLSCLFIKSCQTSFAVTSTAALPMLKLWLIGH